MDFDAPTGEPGAHLRQWIHEAADRTALPNPNAVALATVDADGSPSVRTVLLKEVEDRGLVFYTNYHSRKGRALDVHPRAAVLAFWDALERQVRIEGVVEKVSAAESDAYFNSRPRESRIGAWASLQSQPLPQRGDLIQRVIEFDERYPGDAVPRPEYWGGYRLLPDTFEFWQGREHRLHDRVVFRRDDTGGWRIERLYP